MCASGWQALTSGALEGWRSLLEKAGLKEIQVETHELEVIRQRLDEMQGLEWEDYKDRFAPWGP